MVAVQEVIRSAAVLALGKSLCQGEKIAAYPNRLQQVILIIVLRFIFLFREEFPRESLNDWEGQDLVTRGTVVG